MKQSSAIKERRSAGLLIVDCGFSTKLAASLFQSTNQHSTIVDRFQESARP